MNTIYLGDVSDYDLLDLTKGTYQRDLIHGDAAWSGSDLKGKAAKYGGSYTESRRNLVTRIKDEGYIVRECLLGPHNRRVKVIMDRDMPDHLMAKRVALRTGERVKTDSYVAWGEDEGMACELDLLDHLEYIPVELPDRETLKEGLAESGV